MKKVLLVAGALFIIGLTIFFFLKILKPKPDLVISTDKNDFYHYEFVNIRAKLNNKKIKTPPDIIVVFGAKPVQTIGYRKVFRFAYDKQSGAWLIKWPCPWNAHDGKYRIIPMLGTTDRQKQLKMQVSGFRIISRKLPNVPPGLGVLTLENISPLNGMTMKSPSGGKTDWRGLAEWTEFVGADMFWCLGGSTAYHKNKLRTDFPFVEYNFVHLQKLADECHKRGVKLGVWAIAYMTFGTPEYRPDYKYAWTYDTGELKETRSVSLADARRIEHLIKFYKRLNGIPGIDYYGVDYIRNALGGYELVDDFVKDMEVATPSGWSKYSWQQRVAWLAKKKIVRTDKAFIDQWQWWRAHKASYIIKRIKEESGMKKPFWAFTLSWDKGWQHGQDPKMFADAGVDYDAIMLYECTREQYDELIKKWNAYLSNRDANIIVGDIVDWPLHQNVTDPPGPQEFYDRTMLAVNKIYGDGRAKGIFIHDLGRALWGRLGHYSTYEWLLCGASSISRLRSESGNSAVTSTFDADEKNGKIQVDMKIKAHMPGIRNVNVKFIGPRGYYGETGGYAVALSSYGAALSHFSLPAGGFSSLSGLKFIAASVEWKEGTRTNKYVCHSYLR